MDIPASPVGSAPKWRATLHHGAASLHATACPAFVTSVEPRHTLAVRTIDSIEGEGA
ncbi:DUF6380 family protein [Streptomyces sp. NPDC046939]|uniref:DUF6380 family protein n=1 Tax=Streptomyces sp. NPDC046939 TaxID=3155376 RepID=UPI0033E8E35D